jgi:2-C-methyl-D-erythritol 4-phosphate cytidylyltransferase
MNYHVIIPAAGQGKRMNAGKNKQFIELEGKPVIIHTLEIFAADKNCEGIILVVNSQETDIFQKLISSYRLKKVQKLVVGGDERQHSVYNGLKVLSGNGIVLIHDGARPFLQPAIIKSLVQKADSDGAAIAGIPVKDTIKVTDEGAVSHTLERSSLWAVQTPQAFRLSLIVQAHEEAMKEGFVGTDDASLVERLGQAVYIVQGHEHNIKLTTQEDLIIAQAILHSRKV